MFEETRCKALGENPDAEICISGRLIGGCLDRIARLAGSKYGNIPAFIEKNREDGVILHLENACMAPEELMRTLVALKMNGWFDAINGLMFGRNSGPDTSSVNGLCYLDALRASLSKLRCPVVIDVDIGHKPPQLTLINGAIAQVKTARGAGIVSQRFA